MSDEEESEERELPSTPEEWVMESLYRMRQEIECCNDHASHGDYQAIVMHMTNVAYGAKLTAEMIVEKILEPGQVYELLQAKMQEVLGEPLEFIQDVGGFVQFRRIPIEVPDDIGELDNE